MGQWADHSLTFTAGASDVHAGQVLGIALVDNSSLVGGQTNDAVVKSNSTPANDAAGRQTSLDVVTSNSVPWRRIWKYGALLLLASGLVGLWAFRRYRPRQRRFLPQESP